eukprot:3329091-Prymnesium_polylepis.1
MFFLQDDSDEKQVSEEQQWPWLDHKAITTFPGDLPGSHLVFVGARKSLRIRSTSNRLKPAHLQRLA